MTISLKCRDCGKTPGQAVFLKDNARVGGLRTLCSPCSRERRNQKAEDARRAPLATGVKACAQCRAEKGTADFGKNVFGVGGLDNLCRVCRNAYSSARHKLRLSVDPAYREKNLQQKRQARRAADPDLARRDAARAAQAALRADCAAHVAAYRRYLGDCRAHVAAWKAQPRPSPTDPQQAVYERAKTAYRRARRLGRTVPWCRIRDTLPAYALAAAHERATGTDWHVDHIVPLRADLASGLHCPANLTILPRGDNEAKRNSFSPDHP